ncbi:P-loop containing protein [Fusarium bulbicola]|nr:P-loop containing protein [Fusarium bulbicola]
MAPSSNINIAVIGVTGAGKTTFVSKAANRTDLEIGHGIDSCTQDIKSVTFNLDGNQVTLIDTPGFDDTFKSDGDILQLVANYLSATYEKGTLLNGLILLQPIHGTRLQGNEMKRTRLFKRILGEDAYNRVIIATTMWGMLRDDTHGNQQIQERKDRKDVWGDMEALGAQIVRHDDNQNSALNIIRKVFDFPNPEPLQIQTELVHTNGRVALTSAGRQLDEDLGEVVACLRREIGSLRRERKAAQSEIQDMQERLREIEAQKSSLGGAVFQLDTDFSEMADTEQKITLILTSYLSETQSITAPEAATQINNLFPHQPEKDGNRKSPGGFLAAFWDLAFQIAVQFDYQTQQMQKFISLIKALRDLPSTTILEDGRRLWHDLPDLSLFFTERWNREYSKLTKQIEAGLLNQVIIPPETIRRWINMNGLAAYLTIENLYGGLYRALESIKLGLENGSRREAQNIIDCFAPAAATWFILSSQHIYHMCRENALQDSSSRGHLWKGRSGFSLERWTFWRSRFIELRNNSLATDELREVFLEAETAMETVSE